MNKTALAALLLSISALYAKKETAPEAPKEEPVKTCTKTETSVSEMKDHAVKGIKYAISKEGSGTEAKKGDTVSVHYTGWFKKGDGLGDKFDSSVDRGAPFSFKLGAGRVIRGWDEGVQGMRIGEKRRLELAPEVAYGRAGYPGAIPPNATLIFDVELLAVQSAETPNR